MASKFQNRLVGTIVLVALGVIVLPGLLDGQKKHYQDEFAAIPLVPKAGDRDEPDMMPAATQALPTQPPEGAAEEVRAGDAAAPSLDPATIAANNTEFEPEPAPVVPPKPKPVESPKPKVEAPPAPKPEPKPVVEEKAAPTGKAYVVQLGALKNADKVNEIVGKLRGAGYRVYTSPSTPVQGKITRILVGPDASKEKLKGSLGERLKWCGNGLYTELIRFCLMRRWRILSGLCRGRTVGRIRRSRRIRQPLPDATPARLIRPVQG